MNQPDRQRTRDTRGMAPERDIGAQPLFLEPPSERVSPIGRVEPAVHWLTESTRPEASASRRTVNRWYATFPDADGRMAARLRSERDVDHHQALDELHVHHLLRRSSDDVRYEEGGVGPDFRIYAEGVLVGAVEVLSLFGREDWEEERRRHDRLADELDRRVPPTAGYFVRLKIEEAEREPAPRRFADFVVRKIAELPPYDEFELPSGGGRPQLPTAIFEDGSCRVLVEFMPMKPGAATRSNPIGRIVGLGHMTVGFVNSGARLKERLTDKAGSRYDLGETPFLVAVGVHDTFCTDDQVIEALYGHEAIVVATMQPTWHHDGLFGVDRKKGIARNTRVSAVGVVAGRRLEQRGVADVALLENPLPAVPWRRDLMPATRVFGPIPGSSDRLGWQEPDGERGCA